MEAKKVYAPLSRSDVRFLKAGDSVLLSGEIYTARDAAHKRLAQIAEEGGKMPFDLTDAVIYYVGPTPAKPGTVIGSAGPTSSYRMDAYTPTLIKMGLTGMIGKGSRSQEVIDAMSGYGAVYFGAIGGAGALLMRCIESSEIVAYEDLGAEAICRLKVKDMPLTVIVDSFGNDLYVQGRKAYLESVK